MKKALIPLSFVVILLAGLAIGYYLGTQVHGISPLAKNCVDQTTQQVTDTLIKAGAIKDYTNSLSGTIQSVSGKEVLFTASLVNPLQDASLRNRTAVITDQTKIFVSTLRPQAEIDQAIKNNAEELKKLQSAFTVAETALKTCLPKSSPSGCINEQGAEQKVRQQISQLQSVSAQYSRVEGSLSDIKPNWMITVTAGKSANQTPDQQSTNIANTPKFEAATIEIRQIVQKDTVAAPTSK